MKEETLTNTSQLLVKQFSEVGNKATGFMQQLHPDQMDVKVYEDGAAWTVREVCLHIVEAEGSVMRLIEKVLAGGAGVPMDFNLDRYNESKVKKMGRLSQKEIVEKFSYLRAETIKKIEKLSEDDYDMVGRHPFLGEATVKDMFRIMNVNVKVHIRDIQRVLRDR